MRYMLMIYEGTTPLPGTPEWVLLSDEQQDAVLAADRAVAETPGTTPAVRMRPPEKAVTVRVRDGRPLTAEGAFAGAEEPLAGYLLFETEDPAAAVELAARIPAASMGGAVEVRRLIER